MWGMTDGRGVSRRGFLRAGLGVLVAPAMTGCLYQPTAPTDQQQGNARLTVRPHPPTLDAEIGSTALTVAPVGRYGLLYVPESYDPSIPAPLLVALHGATGRADDWEGFYSACETRGLVLLAVESRGTTWDRVGGYFGIDVPIVDAALRHTFDRCAIDPQNIAFMGFSDGASYALSLGPCNGDIFQHLIAFSPGHTAPNEKLVGTPRIWISHGSEDAILSEEHTRQQIVPMLRGAGYDVTYMEFGGGHEVPASIGGAGLDWFVG